MGQERAAGAADVSEGWGTARTAPSQADAGAWGGRESATVLAGHACHGLCQLTLLFVIAILNVLALPCPSPLPPPTPRSGSSCSRSASGRCRRRHGRHGSGRRRPRRRALRRYCGRRGPTRRQGGGHGAMGMGCWAECSLPGLSSHMGHMCLTTSASAHPSMHHSPLPCLLPPEPSAEHTRVAVISPLGDTG